MSAIAAIIGYIYMALAGILALTWLAALVLNAAWLKVRDGRNLWWVNKAIRHYEKIEPRPTKDES